MEVLVQRFVLDVIPADADTEAQASAREHVDRRGLFRHQRGLALRQDHDAGDELEALRARRQIPEQHEGLVECRAHVVRAGPAFVHRRVGADDVVVREEVLESELFDSLRVRAHTSGIGTDLRLRKDHTDLHDGMSTTAERQLS